MSITSYIAGGCTIILGKHSWDLWQASQSPELAANVQTFGALGCQAVFDATKNLHQCLDLRELISSPVPLQMLSGYVSVETESYMLAATTALLFATTMYSLSKSTQSARRL